MSLPVITPQPRGGHQNDGGGKIIAQYVVKGDYDAVLTQAKARPAGTLITDVGYVLNWQINRTNGGKGIVTYNCADVTSEQWTSNSALKDVWSIRNMQTAISIMRYCGPSLVMNANWYDITQWKKERDKELFDDYKYKDGKDVEHELNDFSKLLADKILQGKETVSRHYPVVTRSRTYAKKPTDDIGAGLDVIGAPAEYSSAAPVWLKVQDDLDQLADGTYKRVEAWQGADELDVNFYGTGAQRWAFGGI